MTRKGADIFCREGKRFVGWAEAADSPVQYQGGESMKMPSKTQNLYAVRQETAPGLNKTDHIAYLTGYPNNTVRPEGYITREETAMIFYRLLDEQSRMRYETGTHPFPDVAQNRWSSRAVATLASAGILRGHSNRRFEPGTYITRAEFAAIAARFDSDAYSGENLFSDIAGHWAANEINHAAQKGWVEGDQNGRFRPEDSITRAEAVTLINRALGRTPQTADDLLPNMHRFKDNADTGKWYYLAIQEAVNGHAYERKADGVHERWTALK